MSNGYKIVVFLILSQCFAWFSNAYSADSNADGFLILNSEPKGIKPRMNLSRDQRLENFEMLVDAIDKNFSFFKHKNIDWPAITAKYRRKIETSNRGGDFYLLMNQFVRELDFHSWLCNYPDVPKLERYSPQMHTSRVEGKCVVSKVENRSEARKKGFVQGSIIVGVNGLGVEQMVEKIKPLMHVYSSQRCFEQMACRRILEGELNSYVSVKFITPDGMTHVERLKRVTSRYKDYLELDFKLKKGRYVWYGRHPSGYGYIRILSFKGIDEIVREFNEALESLRRTPGLLIDVRENTGGLGTSQPEIIGRFISEKTKVSINYIKNGDRHDDFKRFESHFYSTGQWQYTNPVALLLNEVTGSASDLFVCRFVSTERPITIGTTTHGNLTGYAVFVQLPCGLVVRVSHGYVCDVTGRIIEGNGTEPQIQVCPDIQDVAKGIDPVIRRAIKELRNNRR